MAVKLSEKLGKIPERHTHNHEIRTDPETGAARETRGRDLSRVSLEEQASNFSLPSQQRECEKLAEANGYAAAPAFTFTDPGFSGAELDRPALTRLREAAREGLVEAVVCHDPDRLSRKLAHLLLLVEEFERAGVRLLFVNGSVDSTPEGKMFLSMRGAFAEFERLKLAERVSRGRRQKAIEGYYVCGRPPYGYGYLGKSQGKRGELVVDPDQAKVVRRIFTWAAEGWTLLQIARRLDADLVPTLRGAKWSKCVVWGMLKNPAYCGNARFNQRTACEPKVRRKPVEAGRTKRTSTKRRPESEWITVSVPAIIDQALFDRAHAALKRNATLRVGRPGRINLLRGLLRCADCGFACNAYPCHGKPRYRCSNFDRLTNKRRCRRHSHAAGAIDQIVWSEIERMLTDPSAWTSEARAHDRQQGRAEKDAERQRTALEREIFRLRQREQRAAKGMLDSELESVHGTFRADVKTTQAKRRELERQLQALSIPAMPPPKLDGDRLAMLRERVRAADSPEQRREIITLLIPEVRLSDDRIEIDTVLSALALPRDVFSGAADTNRFNHTARTN